MRQIERLPRISIVTPSFNQGEFLEECIDSILGQGYPNLEYVIMDGGSTDNSVEIIRKYEKYLTYWQSKPDGGQYAAINEGFGKTSGEIMAWLNSDDKYHDRSFFTSAHVFATHHDVEWIVGRPSWWAKNGEIMEISESLHRYCRADFLAKKYNDPFIQQESTFWKRSLWDRAGGYVRADLEFAGDLELWMRFFGLTELYSVDALLGGYRSHGNQKAGLAMDRYVAEAESVLEEDARLEAGVSTPHLNPAPEPLEIDHESLKSYMKSVGVPYGSFPLVCRYYQKELKEKRENIFLKQKRIEVIEDELYDALEALQRKDVYLAAIEGSRVWRAVQCFDRLLDRLKRFWR